MVRGQRSIIGASVYFPLYSDITRLHLLPELGRLRLSKLQPQHVERLLRIKLEAGLSTRRAQYIHAVLRRALSCAVRWGLVARNVAGLIDVPRVVRAEVQPLTPVEIQGFLDQVRGDRLEALYVMALSMGLRQGELLGLRWDDYDSEAGSLAVQRSSACKWRSRFRGAKESP